jgi:Zn finger protein HypA/HybF involved in hydrogenase expression
VPQQQVQRVSEDAILDILGLQTTLSRTPALSEGELAEAAPRLEVHEHVTPKKSCHRCNQEISAGTHICPYCHTYIASLQDF